MMGEFFIRFLLFLPLLSLPQKAFADGAVLGPITASVLHDTPVESNRRLPSLYTLRRALGILPHSNCGLGSERFNTLPHLI